MDLFEAFPGMYQYAHLPRLARLIADRFLEEYVDEQIKLSYAFKVPLLAMLESMFTPEQLRALSITSSREYLTYLAENRAEEQLRSSMEKWTRDQLEVVGKFEVIAEDITIINFVRAQGLKKFIPHLTSEMTLALEIVREIDTFMLGANTSSTNLYINILKGRIEEEENFSRKMVEASPAITFIFDLNTGKEVYVSRKITEVVGYLPEDLVDQPDDVMLRLTHPEDLPHVQAHVNTMRQEMTDRMHSIEFRLRAKDGTYRWLRTYEVVFRRDENGLPVEVLGKTFEITREKHTALALEKREQQLLEAQAIARIGSYDWDILRNISSNTPEVFRIFDLDEDQKYEEFISYVHPDDVDRVQAALQESFQTGHYRCEYRYCRKSEKVIWSLGRVVFEEGKPVRMVGTVQDITDIKRIERALMEKTVELERSNHSLQQFAFVASHDLKEPIRKINLFSDMILQQDGDCLSPASRKQLEKVRQSGRTMARMVEDILSFSILESREGRTRTSLTEIIAQVLEVLDGPIQEKAAVIDYSSLPEAEVIPSQFRQLFQNLIGNALKFSRPEVAPHITITHQWLEEPGHPELPASPRYLELTVCDNGIGFPAEQKEKIFELFRRLHSRSEYEGSGLGLSISRRIVENHQGRIKAHPRPEGGACFVILLPQPE